MLHRPQSVDCCFLIFDPQVKSFYLIVKTNYSDLAYISSGAYLILGNDTGPMHLLIACSKKKSVKIVLFGEGSDPDLCAPRGKRVYIIQEKNI